MEPTKQRIAIMASGTGTNAAYIIRYFKHHPEIEVGAVLSNRRKAGVLVKAQELAVPTYTFDKQSFYHTTDVLYILEQESIDYIVLAGFLMLVPEYLIQAFPWRIINIHPALLPKYGGQGMYGAAVHQAVLRGQEIETGITVHYVNAEYDKGVIIARFKCPVDLQKDTTETVQQRVHNLEYTYYPPVIEAVILGKALPGS